MSQITQTIGLRLRRRRTELGYSQERLAELAGLHPTYIGQIERGEKNLTLDSLHKVTRALQLPMSQLLEKADGLTPEAVNYPLLAYELFSALPRSRQAALYQILESVSRYGSPTP